METRTAAIVIGTHGESDYEIAPASYAAVCFDDDLITLHTDIKTLEAALLDNRIVKVFHDAKRCIRLLEARSLYVVGKIEDTTIQARLCGHHPIDLDSLSQSVLKRDLSSANTDNTKCHSGFLFPHLNQRRDQAKAILQLHKALRGQIRIHCEDYYQQELQLVFYTQRIEDRGILIDVDKLDIASNEIDERIGRIRNKLNRINDGSIDPSDSMQVAAMFDRLGITYIRTKSGGASLKGTDLVGIKHAVVNLILQFRFFAHLLSHGIKQIGKFTSRSGILTATYDQSGSISGRYSCKKPNVQGLALGPLSLSNNVVSDRIKPLLEKDGWAISLASLIKVREGYVNVRWDFRQIELRMLAHYSNEPRLIEMLTLNNDVFRLIAYELFDNDSDVSRNKAKIIVYATIYGETEGHLRGRLNVDSQEASRIRRKFDSLFPSVAKFTRRCSRKLASHGTVSSFRGVRYKVKRQHHYKAIHSLLCGTAAEHLKITLLKVGQYISSTDEEIYIINTRHDDLVVEMPIEPRHSPMMDYIDTIDCMVQTIEWNRYALNIPASMELTSTNWSEFTPLKEKEKQDDKRAIAGSRVPHEV